MSLIDELPPPKEEGEEREDTPLPMKVEITSPIRTMSSRPKTPEEIGTLIHVHVMFYSLTCNNT